MSKRPKFAKILPRLRRLAPWAAAAALAVCLAWLGSWLLQRSFRTSSKKRAVQLWLDDTLNADVALLGDMDVRINLTRPSRLDFNSVEIENPNPTFSSKFITADRIRVSCPPLSAIRLYPGALNVDLRNLLLTLEENENGEWNTDGLMNPVASADAPFPFPMPRISNWRIAINPGKFILRRRGNEIVLGLDAVVSGRPDRERVAVRAQKAPFSFTPPDGEQPLSGSIGPATLVVRLGEKRGDMPIPVPGKCESHIDEFPVAIAPFLLGGIPLDGCPGYFRGTVRYEESAHATGVVALEGELADVPLGAFGLPPGSPLRVRWPVNPLDASQEARIHIGPSGFGAFELVIPLDKNGSPKLLSLRGEVTVLDNLHNLFNRYPQWPDWLTRTFPAIEWRSRDWRLFGWRGTNMRLNLSRATAGMNLTGEAELMNGRVRIALTPDREDSPITIAAEKVDAELMSLKLSQALPPAFKAKASGTHVNLTWRGRHLGEGRVGDWVCNMVFAKPSIDLAGSGDWWRGVTGVVDALAAALPEWGGGDSEGLRALAERDEIQLDQLSVVSQRDDDVLTIEFRAYGDVFGQITGLIEVASDGTVEGEYLLAGPSRILETVLEANPEFGVALGLLANDSLGLRVGFTMNADGGFKFTHPFLQDAKRVRDDLVRQGFEVVP